DIQEVLIIIFNSIMETETDSSDPITLQISMQPRKQRNDPVEDKADNNANKNGPQLTKLEMQYPVLPVQYTLEQWSPQNPAGQKTYDSVFLRNLRYTQHSLKKPLNLPDFFFIYDEVQTGYVVMEEVNPLTELFSRLSGKDVIDEVVEEPCELQQPTKFAWQKVQNEGPQHFGHAIVTVNNKIYLLGGRGTDSRSIEIQTYNEDTAIWNLLLNDQDPEEIPFNRWEMSVVPYEHLLFLWGGGNYTKNCNLIYCYDTNNNNWFKPKINSSQPLAGWGHSACIINNALYIFSGTNRNSKAVGLRILDLHKMAWHNSFGIIGDAPGPRWSHTAVGIEDVMYVWGGRDASGADCTTDLYSLDTTTKEWSVVETTGDIPQPRRGHSAAVYKQRMYIFGGYSVDEDKNINDIHCFDPVRLHWERIEAEGEAPSPRDQHVCTVIGNRLLIQGGQSYDAVEDDFVVCKDTWMLQML
ncbi:unnamed protein product, partial [Meganyctiphanes norvegica]